MNHFQKIKLLSTFLFLSVSLTFYSQKKKDLNREWMLINFKNYSKNELIKAKAAIQFVNLNKNLSDLKAYMGCNQMFTSVKIQTPNIIKISPMASTMMACEDFMKLEADFAQEVEKMKYWKVEGHYLILSDGKRNRMKFIASDWD